MNNVRSESFLGSDKVIIGNKYADLVLETLGKVYIKTGNSSQVLSDVLALLDKTAETDIRSQTIIVGSQLEMEEMEYPGDGFFVYNSLTTTLYIAYDERYVALIEAAEGAGDGYVRRKGDSMTGQLEIHTVTPPLIVSSSKLVKNFNAEYIDGYSSNDLAKKRVDEYIYGNWTFKGKGVSENTWTFKDNVRMYGDLVTSRSITSPEFASGFGGYGWRLDADTNTLTIDYLVVRKAMRVYEMVINKISATNGSIWVSNSSKCASATQPLILTETQLGSIGLWTGSDANKDAVRKLLTTNNYYLPAVNSNVVEVTKSSELSPPSGVSTDRVIFSDYKFIIHIKDADRLVNSRLFTGAETLYNETLLASEWENFNNSTGVTQEEYATFKKCISLYYIGKEKKVITWNGTTPKEWQFVDTFNKNVPFYIIPEGLHPSGILYSDLYEDINNGGMQATVEVQPYYKYFALRKNIMTSAIAQSNTQHAEGFRTTVTVPNLWIIDTDDDEYPTFKPGDIIRCQKFADGNIKYYDALIMSQIGVRKFIATKAVSVFDKYTEISYNEDGSVKDYKESYNNTQYDKTETSYNVNTGREEPKSSSITAESRLDDIAKDDDMVQVGNIYNSQRQNAVYLTSSDDNGPYIDVISGLNRPDYSVLYDLPVYRQKEFVNTEIDNGYRGIKYNYYLQDKNSIDSSSIPIYDLDKDGNIILDSSGNKVVIYRGTLFPNRQTLLQKVGDKWKHTFAKTTRVRIGNLSGIYNEIFGKKQPYGFGLYGENVFLTGEFYLNNGQTVVNFSEDQILLKFKMAGITISDSPQRDSNDNIIYDMYGNPIYETTQVIGLDGKPVLDESGNPVYRNKTEIIMQADQMRWQGVDGTKAMQLVVKDPITGKAMLDVQGTIQAYGLKIFGDRQNGMGYGVTAEISSNGNLTAWDATLNNVKALGIYCERINAISGHIGGFEISKENLFWDASNYDWGGNKNTNTCLLGFNTSYWGKHAIVDIAYTYITGYNYGISVVGLGMALFTSQHSVDYPERGPIVHPEEGLLGAAWFDGTVYCTETISAATYAVKDIDGTYTLGFSGVLNGIETDNKNASGRPGSINNNGHVDIIVQGGLIINRVAYG